ncbi:MAG: SpoIIE family protein phosphatase [Magnetococcales bacterium]|nr:SpoIIE family protein phosphatase [Magnetococcales bacterium]
MTNQKTKKSIILIVDDVPENIDVLKGVLESEYRVRAAPNGHIAIKAANITPHPDLILLDIMMPGMDGYEVCRQLKANKETENIPIIFVTAKSEDDDELDGLNLGAVDYITKPINIPILKARVKTHLALKEANNKLDKHNQHLLREREVIEAIILKMRDTDGFNPQHLRFLTSPVEATAGDMLLSTFTPDGRQLVLLGDFTGHGLTAAIGAPLVTYILYELANRNTSGIEILKEINKQLCTKLPTGLFFAAGFLEISPDRKTVNVWNSALPDSLLIRNGKIHKRFISNTMPLGISHSINLLETKNTVTVQEGDNIFVYSDGIIEVYGTNGKMFGNDPLDEFLKKTSIEKNPLDELLAILEDYTGSRVNDDDITLVEVQL